MLVEQPDRAGQGEIFSYHTTVEIGVSIVEFRDVAYNMIVLMTACPD